ncbi:MAG: L-serine ammonia-lyase, iron-sulfur-dependent, subunit alpha [bacterium]|nr:L-serine ammonia-lyase, iron-sulfur-dependent, subunit alpha [bacterium]
MEKRIYREFVEILKEELVPAMGCTEPIAVAYCAALAKKALGGMPDRVKIKASANIIKNVKSVVVPNTGGQRGIGAAAAAGIVAGDADRQLQVLAGITAEKIGEIADFLQRTECAVERSDRDYVFDIQVELSGEGHTAFAEIAGHHTNVIRLERDGEILFDREYLEQGRRYATDRSLLTVERIVEFADCVDVADVQEVLQRQIDYNMAIAKEGLKGNYGANIGSILLKSYGSSVHNRAKAYAAAGSDGRMNGCELPVVINSGSGNQGLTASLPVIVYAEEMQASRETLYRALTVSNLVTIHLKTGIGCLSAYCGATSAGCGAGAGVTYLYGGRFHEIAHTIVNAIAVDSGMICDGAKASCAAKIASAVEAGLLGMQMQMHGSQFYSGDGIVVKGVENTIQNVCELARVGMKETDRTILRLMMGEERGGEGEPFC